MLSDGTNTYTYDAANRLSSVVSGQSSSSYSYNGLGDRVSQTVDGATTNYALDLNVGLTQVLADGTNTYLYGNGRIGELQPGGFAYHLGDALGSVRQLADASANVTLARSYEPFGETLSSVGSGTTVWQFTSEARDASGLTFLRARYLSTVTGRFLTKDTYKGDQQRPMSYNGWLYTEANPINFTDPSGRDICIGPAWLTPKANKCAPLFGKLQAPVHLWPARGHKPDLPPPGVTVALPQPGVSVTNPAATPCPPDATATTQPTPTAPATAQPTATQAPTQVATQLPPIVSASGLQLPIDDPIYWNGYGETSAWGDGTWAPHEGYDITSASNNKQVKAMGSGTVRWTDLPECSVGGKVQYHTLWVETGTIFIAYAHLKCSDKQVGDTVTAGEIIGEYGLHGQIQGNFEHVHITFLTGYNYFTDCTDPGPYWPGGPPTFVNPNRPSELPPCQLLD